MRPSGRAGTVRAVSPDRALPGSIADEFALKASITGNMAEGVLVLRASDGTVVAANPTAELEQFAGALAHDLTDPLRVASGYAELLSERYAENLDQTARGFLEQISTATSRMQRMLDAMRRYARLGGGGLESEPVECRKL